MSDVQETNLNEGKPLDIEDAILAKWDDAEELSEDEAEATQDDPNEETEDVLEEEEIEDATESEDEETDPDEEEETDEDEADDSEDDEDGEEAATVSDETEVEVVVNGESKMVSVASLKRLAGQEASLTQKSQQVAEQRKEAETAIEKNHIVIQKMLQRAHEKLKPYAEVDMLVASKTMETEDFAQLRKEAAAAQDEVKFLEQEADAFYKDLKEQNAQQQQKAAQECVKILQEDLPDWSNKLYDDIRSYAVSQGLPKEAVDQYVDPNVIKLINKARLYDGGKQVALTKKKKTAAKAKVLRTKKSPDKNASSKATAEKARQTMVANGGRDLDDIAAAILGNWEVENS